MGRVRQTERLIKKYPNRRLYDTATSTYITLVDVKQMVLDHEKFSVIDAKTNADLTRSILLQIILEEEVAGSPIFSSELLSQIIRFYGHAMQGLIGPYLEQNVKAFNEIQNHLSTTSKKIHNNSQLNSDFWSQFVNMQGPVMQSVMSTYIEQSKDMFLQMQQQIQNQTEQVINTFSKNFNSVKTDPDSTKK